MKITTFQLRAAVAHLILATACVSSVGCKDTLQLKERRREVVAQTDELRAEFTNLETKLMDLRKAMPTGSTPKASAEAMTKVHQRDLEGIAREQAIVAQSIAAQEEKLAALQKEIDDFKALTQTQKTATPPRS